MCLVIMSVLLSRSQVYRPAQPCPPFSVRLCPGRQVPTRHGDFPLPFSGTFDLVFGHFLSHLLWGIHPGYIPPFLPVLRLAVLGQSEAQKTARTVLSFFLKLLQQSLAIKATRVAHYPMPIPLTQFHGKCCCSHPTIHSVNTHFPHMTLVTLVL